MATAVVNEETRVTAAPVLIATTPPVKIKFDTINYKNQPNRKKILVVKD